MSLDGIQGNVLRDLFALIGRNIAGDPLPPPAPVPSSAQTSAPQPQSQTPAYDLAPVRADTSFPQSVSLAGLRDPAALQDTPAARAAMRAALATVLARLTTTAPPMAPSRDADMPDAAASPATESGSMPLASPRPAALPVLGAGAMNEMDNPQQPEAVVLPAGAEMQMVSSPDIVAASAETPLSEAPASAADSGGAAESSQGGAQKGAAALPPGSMGSPTFGPSVSFVAAPQEGLGADAGGMPQATFSEAVSPGPDPAGAQSAEANRPEPDRAAVSSSVTNTGDAALLLRDADAVDPRSSARTGLTAESLDLRLAVFSLASALDELMPRDGGGLDATTPAGLFPAEGQPLQAERAGVIASFILNAAMIPGWPPPRPIEGVPLAAGAFVNAQKELSDTERDLLLHLGKLLHSPETLRKLLRKVAAGARRTKLMAALGFVLTVMDDVATLLMAELERLEDLIRDEKDGPRHRLRLR